MSTQVQLKNLEAATIPLTGRHLSEASAGTGKTYNITRIYTRARANSRRNFIDDFYQRCHTRASWQN
mgnify:CR=1 FL=1